MNRETFTARWRRSHAREIRSYVEKARVTTTTTTIRYEMFGKSKRCVSDADRPRATCAALASYSYANANKCERASVLVRKFFYTLVRLVKIL